MAVPGQGALRKGDGGHLWGDGTKRPTEPSLVGTEPQVGIFWVISGILFTRAGVIPEVRWCMHSPPPEQLKLRLAMCLELVLGAGAWSWCWRWCLQSSINGLEMAILSTVVDRPTVRQ